MMAQSDFLPLFWEKVAVTDFFTDFFTNFFAEFGDDAFLQQVRCQIFGDGDTSIF